MKKKRESILQSWLSLGPTCNLGAASLAVSWKIGIEPGRSSGLLVASLEETIEIQAETLSQLLASLHIHSHAHAHT